MVGMSSRRSRRAAFAAAALASALVAAAVAAQTRRLIAGGGRATFEIVTLNGGFEAPHEVRLTSGGNLDVRAMRLGPGCVGFAMERPDVIVRYAAPAERLVLHARANAGDTTLIVHTPDDRWVCDDDGAGGNNPRIELADPPAGQYDVWVGSYRPDQHLSTALRLRERD